MRSLFPLLIILLAAYARLPRSSAEEPKKLWFIFDLDQTLIDARAPSEPVPRGLKTMTLQLGNSTQHYLIREGALEALQSFSEIPGAELSILSLNSPDRNLAAAKTLILPNGKSAYEVTQGRVFSMNHMIQYEMTNHPGSTDFFVKNLNIITPHIDPDRAFLIDNSFLSAADQQMRNLVWVRDRRTNKARLTDAERIRNHFSNRNKLAWARGIIDKALENAARTGRSPVAEMGAIQHNAATNRQLDLYNRGVGFFKQVNPAFKPTPLIPTRCAAKVLNELLSDVFHLPVQP